MDDAGKGLAKIKVNNRQKVSKTFPSRDRDRFIATFLSEFCKSTK